MKYPSIEEVETVDHLQLARWCRFLPSPGVSALDCRNYKGFRRVLEEEKTILNTIIERFNKLGGMTPCISKQINKMKRIWDKKDLWRLSGSHFLIEVSRHTVINTLSIDTHKGPHRWCVYAYIYPQHPHFKRITGDNIFQEATLELPLHWLPSLLRYHYNSAGDITSVQIGADYDHIEDIEFTWMKDEIEANECFEDAEHLFEWLEHNYD